MPISSALSFRIRALPHRDAATNPSGRSQRALSRRRGRQNLEGLIPAGATPTHPPWERVAQSVEHLTFNQRVPGSNPGALTNLENVDLSRQTASTRSAN